MVRRTIAVVALLFALSFLAPKNASAQFAVVDVPHTVQSWILQGGALYEHIRAWYQRYEQIANQYKQIEAEYRQLKSWVHDGEWHNLIGVYGSLEGILDRIDHLAYQTQHLEEMLNETFPGIQLPTVDFDTDYRTQLRRSMVTNKDLLNVMDHISRMNMMSQIRLAQAQDRVGNSDGAVQTLQATGMIASLAAEDTGRVLQATLLGANSAALMNTFELQQRATSLEVLKDYLTRNPPPELASDNGPGFTGVPAGWSW